MTIDSARAKSLFLTASDLADPVKRSAFLDQECGGDAKLRARVEALLKAHDESPMVTPDSAIPTLGGAPSGPIGQESILTAEYRTRLESGIVVSSRYILEQKIGEGGMGEVWVAKQTEPVKRRVALKLIKPGMDSRTVLARFDQERQALALMDHPNIARVLDAGLTPTGQPFFVMELVNGLALNKFCDELKLTPRERLELFVPICQAVQHAHQKGIVHRDLKPANILITMIDGKPVPKVIDFGVAKATAGKLSEDSIATQFGSVVGTLEYMSPEQAGFSGEDIDTRSDIYSLGVILYEMLTGLKPIDATRIKKAALTEMIRIIREEDPSRPSTRLSTNESLPSLAALRRTEPRKLMSMLKGELDWVVMKCLEKQRERRYETANGLAREIQRYLADEMVEARPPSTSYRLSKFVRKYPLQLALSGTLLLLVLGGAGVIWWQQEQAGFRREAELRQQLEKEQRAAMEVARNARNAEAVVSLLGQCEDALRSDDSKRAGLVLEAAKMRSAEGGAEESAEKLSKLEIDLALLKGLDEVDRFRWTVAENKLPEPGKVADRFRAILGGFGLDPETARLELALTLASASVIRDRIIFGWDWLLGQRKSQSVRLFLSRLDPDPFREAVRDAVIANDRKRILELANQNQAEGQPPRFAAILGEIPAISVERRRHFLQKALWDRPGNFGLLMTLGESYPIRQKGNAEERLRWYQAAIASSSDSSAGYNNLGIALFEKKEFQNAINVFEKTISIDPSLAIAHNNLGKVKLEIGEFDKALTSFQKAIELNHDNAIFINNKGKVLREKGLLNEAISCFKKSIEIDPQLAPAYSNLGVSLKDKFQNDASIASFKKALEIDPSDAPTHYNLGVSLMDKGIWDAAIDCYKKAIELDPEFSLAHNNLGLVLVEKNQLELAIASYKKAIEIDPKFSIAYNNLGVALKKKGKINEAIVNYNKSITFNPNNQVAFFNLAICLQKNQEYYKSVEAYRKAIALNPKFAEAHANLGLVLELTLDLEGAISCFQKAIEISPQIDSARQGLARVQPLFRALVQLPDYRKGSSQLISNEEWLHFGQPGVPPVFNRKAAELYARAFSADPLLAEDLEKEYRYSAVCFAVLASAGKDTAILDGNVRNRLRGQALDWLKADLAAYQTMLTQGTPAQKALAVKRLTHWQTDPDLASIREKEQLSKIPPEEAKGITQLWRDVARAIQTAAEKQK